MPPTPNNNNTQTGGTEDLSKQLKENIQLLTQQNKLLSDQADILSSLVSSMKQMSMKGQVKELSDATGLMGLLTGKMRTVQKTAKGLDVIGTLLHDNSTKAKLLGAAYGILNDYHVKLGGTGAAALTGFAQGAKLSINLTKVLITNAKNVAASMGHFAASVITFPFKMLRGLIEMADTGGSNELATELEEIRKQFGYLKREAGGAIIDLAKGMKGQLANTGLSVYRIFGNLVGRLQYFREYATKLGPLFDGLLTGTLKVGEGGAEALGAYNKALGFTDEGLKAVASRAFSSGKDINELNREIANYSLQLSSSFGVTMKTISREIGDMMADFQHFGHLGVRELSQVAVYARRLGVEVKALGGVMDKFMNFEDAAQGAAQLSQAFGLNVDALRLMKAQDPADKIEQLRKAFFQAGRSVENMTYQERRLLAQQTGLDDASVGLVFSLKNQGLSYDQVKKKGDTARKSQLTQAEALQKLSGAIERLVKSGSASNLGFIDRFIKGFLVGIRRSREFRQVLHALRNTLHQTFRAGIQVGRMFVQIFPGVKQFFEGLKGFFNPRGFKTMLGGVETAFHTFFEQIAGKNPKAFPNLLKTLKETFFNYFDSRSEAGQKFLGGAKAMFTAFATIANSILVQAIHGVTTGIELLVDILSGRKSLSSIMGSLTNGSGFFSDILSTLIKGIGTQASDLGDALKTLLVLGWEKIKPYVIGFLKVEIGGTVAVSAGSAFVRGLLTTIGGGLLQGLTGVLKNSVEASMEKLKEATGRAASASTGVTGLTGAAEAARGSTGVVNSASGLGAAANNSKINPNSLAQIALVAGFIAIGFVGLLAAMGTAIYFIRQYKITPGEIAKAASIMVASGIALVAAAGAAALVGVASKAMAGVNPAAMAGAFLGLGVVIGGMILTAYGMTKVVKDNKFTKEDVVKASVLMAASSALVLAASGVLVVATGLGTLFALAPQLAIASAIGLLAIGLVVDVMVKGTMGIMRTIDRFRPSPGFEAKAETFLKVISGVSGFVQSFAGVAGALAPSAFGSLISALFGNDPQKELRATLQKVLEIITVSTTQITLITDTLLKQASNATVEQLQKLDTLVTALGSIGSFVKNLQPSAELLKNTSAWFEVADVVPKIQETSIFIRRMSIAISSVVDTVLLAIRTLNLQTFNESSLKGAEMFTTVLKGVGDLAQSLMPRTGTLEQLNKSADFAGALGHVSTFMNGMINNLLNTGLLTSIKTVVTNIVDKIKDLNPQQIATLTAVAPALNGAMRGIVGIANLFTSLTGSFFANRTVDTGVIFQVTQFVNSLMERVQSILPEIIQRISSIRLDSNQGNQIKGKMSVIKSTFETIQTIPSVFEALKGSGSGNPRMDAAAYKLRTVSSFINAMFNTTQGTPGGDLKAGLDRVAGWEIPPGISEKIGMLSRVKNLLTATGEIGSVLSTVSTQTQAMAARIETNTKSRIGDSIRAMVTEINSISKELESIKDLPNVNVSLRRLANDIGLGENGEFSIHKGNINLNMKFQIVLDSRDLQTSLVQTSRNTTQGPRVLVTTT